MMPNPRELPGTEPDPDEPHEIENPGDPGPPTLEPPEVEDPRENPKIPEQENVPPEGA